MAGKGPAPIPSKTLKLRGSWRGNSRPDEPEPEVIFPDPPAGIPAAAKTEWRRIRDVAKDLGYVTQLDRATVAAYCCSYALWLGLVKAGDLPKANKEAVIMLRFIQELGLSPSSRTRCKVVKKDKATDGKVGFGQAG